MSTASPPETPPANPRVFGRYEVIRRLGSGGMGEIFLSRQVGVAGFDRLAILKSILPENAGDPDALDQFLNEARIMGCISHPHVVAVYEVGEWEGTYFMAMEYVDGVDVAEIVQAAGAAGMTLSARFVATVGRDAAAALDFAHFAKDSNGNPLQVVHRDVTPHNIMVRRDGVVKVVDFGVARSTNRRKKTETGVLKGKLGYFSPEQCAGDDVDGRSDQFVLGVVLWELLTGQRAFPGDNTAAIIKRISTARLERASTKALVAPALDDIVHRMTALDPGERYARCADAAAALRDFVNTTSGDESELASVVARLLGKKLDERKQGMTHEPVLLEGRTLTFGKQGAGGGAVDERYPLDVLRQKLAGELSAESALPQPGVAPRRSRESVIDLELISEQPIAILPKPAPAAARQRARDSFREIELDLGPDSAAPLEIGRTGRFRVGASGLAADVVELDAPAPAVTVEALRDEITVVWCALGVVSGGSEGRAPTPLPSTFGSPPRTDAGATPPGTARPGGQPAKAPAPSPAREGMASPMPSAPLSSVPSLAPLRDKLLGAMRDVAAKASATFLPAGDAVAVIFGAQRASNESPERAVKLASELLGAVDDANVDAAVLMPSQGASGAPAGAAGGAGGAAPGERLRIVGRVGVATGLSPQRDSRGSCAPTLQDTAVDRARRLAALAAEGRAQVAQDTQRFTGRRIRYSPQYATVLDQWNAPFVASEIVGYGKPPPPPADLVGRAAVLAELRPVIDSAARRRAAGVVVVGDGGTGKSLLLVEAERLARWKGLVVARAGCGRTAANAPFDVVRQLVRSAALDVAAYVADDTSSLDVDRAAAAPGAAAGGGGRGRKAAAWRDGVRALGLGSADTRRLTILLGEREGEAEVPSAARRALMRGAVFALFRAAAEQHGLCVVLDDLHRVDAGSLELLSALLAQLADARIALVATSRVAMTERALTRLPRLALPPLPADLVAELGHRISAQLAPGAAAVALPPVVAELIRQRAAGNPLHVRLLVRACVASGAMERLPNGWALRADPQKLAAALPTGLGELAQWVAARCLSTSARALLRIAAHVGHELHEAVLQRAAAGADVAAAAGGKQVGVAGAVGEGVALDLLQPVDAAAAATGVVATFTSSLVREALAALPPDPKDRSEVRPGQAQQQRGPHAAVADALDEARLGDAPLEQDMLTFHTVAAELRERYIASSVQSATYHAWCGHLHAASESYQRALVARYKALDKRSLAKGGADDAAAIDAVLSLAAQTVEIMGEIDPVAAADFFAPLLKELPPTSAPLARARLQRRRALVLLRLGRVPDAERVLDDALELCPPEQDAEEAAHILVALVQVLEARGDVNAAIVQLRQVFHVVKDKRVVDRTFFWNQWLTLGRLQLAIPDAASAQQSLDRALVEAKTAKSTRGIADVTALMARAAVLAGDVGRALTLLDDAAREALAWGDRAAAARALQSAARIAAGTMSTEAAQERLSRALELARVAEWPEGVAAIRDTIAKLAAAAR